MRTLYPQLTADPALLSTARTLFGQALASDNYGIQLVAEFQDEADGDIIIDNIMSQSDLLFVLHAGGVYQPDASANRVFASDLFPVYLNKEEFVQTYPQLIAMSLELLSKNRSNQTWMAYIDSMRRFGV